VGAPRGVIAAPLPKSVANWAETCYATERQWITFKNDLTESGDCLVAAVDFTSSEMDSTIGNNQERFYRVHFLDP